MEFVIEYQVLKKYVENTKIDLKKLKIQNMLISVGLTMSFLADDFVSVSLYTRSVI